MLASGALAAVFFIGLPVVWLGTIGPEGLGQDLADALGPTFAPLAGSFAKSAAIGFMTFNMFHGTLQPLAGASRTLSQLADDGLAPRILALRLSTDVPWVATLLTASFAILFLLIGDPIWLIAAANFTYLIGICLPSVAVWLLRRDDPQAVRPYRAPRGTIVLGLAAAGIWGCSALLGFEQFGLTTILIGLLMALSGAGIYAWRKIEDRRRRGLRGFGRSLHIKLTGTILLVLALDAAGYMLAIDAIPNSGNHAFITILEDIFVAVAFLTISVGIVIPGMIAHSADQVSEAARRLALGTVREFVNAMDALGQGRLEAAHATVDLIPIVVHSRDELGMMAQSFNLLQDGIKHAAIGLQNAREGLHTARKDLLDANAALASTIDEQERLGSELLRSKEAAIHEASHDPLTGLPNRSLFISRLEAALAMEGAGGSRPSAVLFVDLDRFKIVNDSLGHRAGDELIVQVADRLRTLFRGDKHLLKRTHDRAVLARLGGDEFVVLLANIKNPGEAQAVADRIQKALAPPFVIENQDVYTSASIGIALSSIGHVTSADILRDADLAMYRAKNLGKARAETYDASMLALATSRMMLEGDLRRALRNKEFVLHYQPIVRLATGETVGFEALVRWQPPGRDLVYPGEFIAVAEETGLILPLGLWVLGEACLQARIWEKLALKNPLYISVNISPRQFAQDDLVQQLQKVLSDTGIDPGLVKLEITESGTMGNPERAVRILSQLKSIGVDLTIDDFGTGYSSLSYLQRFPLDVLKIDRSFVSGLIDNTESRQIIKTIMALASGMGMDVVAEGIENVEQAIEMRRLGCRFGQGYWFSKPLTASDATALTNNRFTKPLPRLVVA
jgi:diguanylate cyclase (GGDEF)-like protein